MNSQVQQHSNDPREWYFDEATQTVTHSPYYRDPECFSCQRAGKALTEEDRSHGWREYAFCGHIWDAAWKTCVATVTVTNGRVWTNEGSFEGAAYLARDLAATLAAAAKTAEKRRA